MITLSIDTSEQACSIALAGEGTVIDSASEIIGRGHAERLLPLIEERMAATGHTYKDLKRIAVTTGPGTFTGLRIGLSVARGLALQADIPCVGVTGLSVLAAQVSASNSVPVHALITGRGGQAFYQRFQGQGGDGMPIPTTEPVGLDAEEIAPQILSKGGVLVGSGVDLLLEKRLVDSTSHDLISIDPGRVIDPATLAQMAQQLTAADYPPEPTYFRAADAKKATPVLPVRQPAG